MLDGKRQRYCVQDEVAMTDIPVFYFCGTSRIPNQTSSTTGSLGVDRSSSTIPVGEKASTIEHTVDLTDRRHKITAGLNLIWRGQPRSHRCMRRCRSSHLPGPAGGGMRLREPRKFSSIIVWSWGRTCSCSELLTEALAF